MSNSVLNSEYNTAGNDPEEEDAPRKSTREKESGKVLTSSENEENTESDDIDLSVRHEVFKKQEANNGSRHVILISKNQLRY